MMMMMMITDETRSVYFSSNSTGTSYQFPRNFLADLLATSPTSSLQVSD